MGFVLSANESTVEVVEGNVSVGGTRGVDKKVRPRYNYVTDDMVIIGFGVPAYSGEEVPKARLGKSTNVRSSKNFSIDAEKFETQLSADERVKLREKFRLETENAHESFTTIISPTPIGQNRIPAICEKEYCIYNTDK